MLENRKCSVELTCSRHDHVLFQRTIGIKAIRKIFQKEMFIKKFHIILKPGQRKTVVESI